MTRDNVLGVYEVTQAQYKRVMGTNPSYLHGVPISGVKSDHPVNRVSWEDVVAFCMRLSELPEERLPEESIACPPKRCLILSAPVKGSCRVSRGGSWRDGAANCMSTYRNWDDPAIAFDDGGFRVALSSSGMLQSAEQEEHQ